MSRREWAALIAIVLASLVIVGGNTYVPMNDASSHMATGLIAYRLLQGDTFTAAHYRFDLLPLPYWGTTLGLLPLVPLLGPFGALHALLAIYVVALPVSFYITVPHGGTRQRASDAGRRADGFQLGLLVG